MGWGRSLNYRRKIAHPGEEWEKMKKKRRREEVGPL
jgi:hypothetical protein